MNLLVFTFQCLTFDVHVAFHANETQFVLSNVDHGKLAVLLEPVDSLYVLPFSIFLISTTLASPTLLGRAHHHFHSVCLELDC